MGNDGKCGLNTELQYEQFPARWQNIKVTDVEDELTTRSSAICAQHAHPACLIKNTTLAANWASSAPAPPPPSPPSRQGLLGLAGPAATCLRLREPEDR